MKTIKEAAREFQRDYPTDIEERAAYSAFKAGVEYAQRWISVEDELPEITEEGCNCVEVLYMTKNGLGGICLFKDGRFETLSKVTHWRPIEWK